jgi:hypothetical protein
MVSFLMKRVRLDKTVVWKTMDVAKMMEDLDGWIGEKEEEIMMVGDIKNMYTELPHKEIVKVTEWLLDQVKELVRESEWIRVARRGRRGGMFGRGVDKKKYVEMRTKDITKVVDLI